MQNLIFDLIMNDMDMDDDTSDNVMEFLRIEQHRKDLRQILEPYASQFSRIQVANLERLLDLGLSVDIDFHDWYYLMFNIVKSNPNLDYVSIHNVIETLKWLSSSQSVFYDIVNWMDATNVHSLKICLGGLYRGFRLEEEGCENVKKFLNILYEGLSINQSDRDLIEIAQINLLQVLKLSRYSDWYEKFEELIEM